MKRLLKKIICSVLVCSLIFSQSAVIALAADDSEDLQADSATATEGEAGTAEGENTEENPEDNPEDNPDEDSAPEVYSGPMTLDYALEKALSNNTDVLTAANNLEKAKLDKAKSDRDTKKFYDAVGKPTPGKIEQTKAYYQVLVYAPAMVQKQLEMSQYAYDLAVSSTQLNVITKYFTIANYGKTEIYTVAAYNNAVNSYNVAKAMYGQGMIARVDLMNAELQMNAARQTALSARVNTNKAKRDLLAYIGLEPTSTFSIATTMEYTPLGNLDVNQTVSQLITNSPAVGISKTTFDIAGIQYDWDSRYYLDYSYTAQVALSTYKNAENDYNKTVLDSKAAAYNMVESLQDAERTYTTSLSSLDNVKESYRIAKLQYQYGLITFNDVQMAEAEIYSTESKIYSALMQYSILKTALDNNIIVTQ